jgi:site-specific DNA recombinase
VIETVKELDARGWKTKSWTTRKGREHIGRPFNKNSLFKLLTNVLYTGKMTIGRETFEGEHAAIVDDKIFRRTQALLRRNGRSGGKHVRGRIGALLKNLVHCVPCDCSMVHNHTTRKNKGVTKRYRYYVCLNAQKRGWHNCPSKSVPAAELEKFVVDQIRCIGKDSALLAETVRQTHAQGQRQVAELESEKNRLEQECIRLDAKLQRLASTAGETDAADEMAELQERIQADERRATQLREEIIRLSRQNIDERELASALSLFDPVWDTLAPREQRRVLQLLIERVDYDGEKSTVSITFHPAGIKTLADELNVEDEE